MRAIWCRIGVRRGPVLVKAVLGGRPGASHGRRGAPVEDLAISKRLIESDGDGVPGVAGAVGEACDRFHEHRDDDPVVVGNHDRQHFSPDRRLSDLAQVISNSPLGQVAPDVDAIAVAISEARAAVTHRGIGTRRIAHLENLRQQHLHQIAARDAWIEDNADLIH